MSPSLKTRSRGALASASAIAALSTLALGALPSVATAQEDRQAIAAPDDGALIPLPEATGQYYIVTRRDLRKCVAPGCGGYYVKAVNQLLTTCVDGTKQYDCHAYKLDVMALGLTEQQLEALTKQYGAGQALIRGELNLVPLSETARFSVTGLVASEAWLGQGPSKGKPMGSFYRVKDNGVRCITYPCPSLTQQKLNTRETQAIAGLDLTPSRATPKQIDAGTQALFAPGGVLAVGMHKVITGPAGRGKQLVASQFYLPLAAGKR